MGSKQRTWWGWKRKSTDGACATSQPCEVLSEYVRPTLYDAALARHPKPNLDDPIIEGWYPQEVYGTKLHVKD